MGMISEFKDFINRGSVLDLAVGVVIGAAFGKIVNSFVNDVLMPPIGMALSGVKFTDIKIFLKQGGVDADGNALPDVTINIGNFLQVMIEFMIIAFFIFLVVKFFNQMKKKKEEAMPAPGPSKEEVLLTEIRDLLKK